MPPSHHQHDAGGRFDGRFVHIPFALLPLPKIEAVSEVVAETLFYFNGESLDLSELAKVLLTDEL